MLEALKFVATAIARKDYVPGLTHYKIENGRVTCFNGIFAMSSEIDLDFDVRPHGAKFLAAIKACPGTIALNMTPGGKLAVKSENFKAYIDCMAEELQTFVEPEGEEVDVGPQFIEGIRALSPVMGIDASRPWSMGIKIQSQYMFSTNNLMLAQYWHGSDLPFDIVVPDLAIHELIRINQAPVRVQLAEKSMTFWFDDSRWLRTNLIEGTRWPTDQLDRILSASNGEQVTFPDGFFDNLETLKPFLGEYGTIYLTSEGMFTSRHEGDGTMIECDFPMIKEMQAYHFKQLTLLKDVATTIDWTAYPAPLMFRGNRLRGAIVGQRM